MQSDIETLLVGTSLTFIQLQSLSFTQIYTHEVILQVRPLSYER
jgi:hypothetical protein